MTATTRFTRVAVAVALGVTAPCVLHAEGSQKAPVELALAGAPLARPESAAIGPTHRSRPVLTDTSSKRERGKNERTPVASPKRRTIKAKNGAAPAPQPTPGSSQYVPDQPWETEFFVDNTVPTRHFAVRLAFTNGN